MTGTIPVFFMNGTAEQFPAEFDQDDLLDIVEQADDAHTFWLKTLQGCVVIPAGRVEYIEWREDSEQ